MQAAFETVLGRPATAEELAACEKLLARHKSPAGGVQPVAVEMLIHVLLNHNDFVTIR